MKTKVFIMLLMFCFCKITKGQEQKVDCIILNEDYSPVQFASIYNLNKHCFTHSNSDGFFKLTSSIGDTLEISHLSYQTKKVIVIEQLKEVTLESKVISIKEIIIKPSNIDQYEILQESIKSTSQYGLAMNSEYYFQITNPYNRKLTIRGVLLPISFRKKASNEGILMAQVFKFNKMKNLRIAISEPINLNVKDYLNKKTLKIEFSGIEINPNENLFVLLKRIVPEVEYNKRSKSLSVNPFIYFSSKKMDNKKMSYIKIMGDNNLHSLSELFGFNPLFDIKILVDKTVN